MMKHLTFKIISRGEYEEIWKKARIKCPYSSPEWIDTIRVTYGYPSVYIMVEDKVSGGKGGLPFMLVPSRLPIKGRRWVSIPFSDRSCIIGDLDVELDVEDLSRIKILLDKIYPADVEVKGIIENSNEIEHYNNFLIPLTENWRFRKKSVVPSAKKAKKMGARIIRSSEWNSLVEFYRLYSLSHLKFGVPVQPLNFFHNIWKFLMKKGMSYVTIAKWQDKVIAGAVFILDKNTIVYKYGATDPEHLNLGAMDLILYTEILNARTRYEYFDLGRANPQNEGLVRYKKKWGAKAFPIPYYSLEKGYLAPAEESGVYSVVTGILRKSAPGVLKILGRYFYSYLA